MAINYDSQILSLYAGSVITDAAYQSPGTYNIPLSYNDGRVTAIAVNAAGSGFTSTPTVAFDSTYGSGGAATATLTATSVASFTVTAAGNGYTAAPGVTLVGPGGTGATATSRMKALTGTTVTAAAGTGYAPADTITLAGGTSTTAAVVTVTNTKLVSLALNAAGSGYAIGDTITLTAVGGTMSTAVVLTVLTVSSGAVATFSITNPGVFTGNSTSFTQASTTGSGTGATFQIPVYGVNVVSVSTPGLYSALPTNPAAQGSTSGSGTGATFNVDWGVSSLVLGAAGSGYTGTVSVVFSSGNAAATAALTATTVASYTLLSGGNYSQSPSVTVSGGGGTGATVTLTFDADTAERRMLTLIEVIRAYMANIASPTEAKLMKEILTRMTMYMVTGAPTGTYSGLASTAAGRAQAAAIRFYATRRRSGNIA